jgi:hypothetical protein
MTYSDPDVVGVHALLVWNELQASLVHNSLRTEVNVVDLSGS